jgi:divalent metal cation (Fe/Co/Zn/Cd) transporter
MPVKIKLGLSLGVVIVAAIACYFQHALGHDRIQYVVAFLGGFMIFAMWLFPEVKRTENAAGASRDAAARQRPGHQASSG